MPDSKRKAIEGDELLRNPKATGDDDVEGHRFTVAQAIEGDELLRNPKATGDDDVEGHRFTVAQAIEGDELLRNPKATGDDDVEGHRFTVAQAIEGDELLRNPKATEDDVEGHNIGAMNPIMARELARARERDVQREVSRNSLIADAKRAQRKR